MQIEVRNNARVGTRRGGLTWIGSLCCIGWMGILWPCVAGAQEPSRAQILRGMYGPGRANNDLLSYDLSIRVNPQEKAVSGSNRIKFRMLAVGQKIQMDLDENLAVDGIFWQGKPLEFTREFNAVMIQFPQPLPVDSIHEIDFRFSGNPPQSGRFGGLSFRTDPQGRDWVTSACEDVGASSWWPCKDQWRDEVEGMDLHVEAPSSLVDVSNGRFLGKTELGDGFTRWDWRVHYPINSYNVSVNLGHYVQFGETMGDLTLDYYCLPEDLDRARQQFQQVRPMMEAFFAYFGEYPFPKDGYKLIQVPYTGMEHQSAVTYGNGFQNGYGGRDWTGVGISPRFDFIIVHESGHEWFGNAVSAADVSDMWIQEGWTTYLESLYVEHLYGREDAFRYVNGYKDKVQNRSPILTQRGEHRTPHQDMYFKGALFLHTLRNVLDDDSKWKSLLRETYEKFKYRNILTEDLQDLFNAHFERDLTAIFDQYLRYKSLPILELERGNKTHEYRFRWKADVPGFNMPIRLGRPGAWTRVEPGSDWQSLTCEIPWEELTADLDSFFIEVDKR